MKKIVLYILLFIGANVLLVSMLAIVEQSFVEAFYNIWYSVALLAELFVGGILVTNSRTKEIGKGLLLSAAVLLLIGLSVCTGLW